MKAAVVRALASSLKHSKRRCGLPHSQTASYHAKVVSGDLDGESEAGRILFKYFSVYFM